MPIIIIIITTTTTAIIIIIIIMDAHILQESWSSLKLPSEDPQLLGTIA
jgi:hypothetical protein